MHQGADAVGYESSERDNNSRRTHNTQNTMQTEQTTRYFFENRSQVSMSKTSISAELGTEKIHLMVLNEEDLFEAVCSYVRCIKYRDAAEARQALQKMEQTVANVREYLDAEAKA